MSISSNITLEEVFREARKGRWAIGQFNFSTIDQLQGIVSAARELDTPVICGTSMGEVDFLGMEEVISLIRAVRKKENVPIFLNLDHAKDIKLARKAIDSGYDMIQFDGSEIPYEDNVRVTGELVDYAKKKSVLVEGEVCEISGKSTVSNENLKDPSLTSIEKVAKFTKYTGVDCIALGVGNVHGIHKGSPELRLGRISDFLGVSDCFVTMHGGSGVEDEKIREAAERGVVKVNLNTELRVAWRKGVESSLKDDKNEMAPYRILSQARNAVYKKTREKMIILRNK